MQHFIHDSSGISHLFTAFISRCVRYGGRNNICPLPAKGMAQHPQNNHQCIQPLHIAWIDSLQQKSEEIKFSRKKTGN